MGKRRAKTAVSNYSPESVELIEIIAPWRGTYCFRPFPPYAGNQTLPHIMVLLGLTVTAL